MRNKVLFVCSRFPYPPLGGDRLRCWNFLKTLCKYFDVHLVTITDKMPDPSDLAEVEEITSSCKVFVKPAFQSKLRCLKTLINGKPLQVNYYHFYDVQKYVDELEPSCDLLVSMLIRTASYLDKFDKKKVIDLTDSIALNYARSRKYVDSLFWKFIYLFESKILSRFEIETAKKFDASLLVNRYEVDYFAKNNCEKVHWSPNGVRKELFDYSKKDSEYKNCIAFLGKMNYQPNVDAVTWFAENVMPHLNSDLRFLIVGMSPTDQVCDLAVVNNKIEVTGFVEDPYLILNSACCVVAPMQTGGGIQNKILESMALGTVNVTTSLGARPIIGDENTQCLIVEDDPEKMASSINAIYSQPEKYVSIKKEAQSFIKDNYTWDIYEEHLIKIIKELNVLPTGESVLLDR